MEENYLPSETNKHNAVIAYCFLAIFMLISQSERFRHPFVRSHAKYAAIIHASFLALIVALIRSRNFSSVILFDITWVNSILYVGFFILLLLLMIGIFRALHGHEPRFSLDIRQNTDTQNNNYESVGEGQKIPIVLSHIPFCGRYLYHKYGKSTYRAGEKWGNWVFIIGCILAWIDPTLTLFLFGLIAATIWLVYQSVMLYTDNTVRLIGDRLPSKTDLHQSMRSIVLYIEHIFSHEKGFPTWTEIYNKSEKNTTNTQEQPPQGSPIWAVPIINIYMIYRSSRTTRLGINSIQCLFLSVGVLIAYIYGSLPLFLMVLLVSWDTFFELKNQATLDIPIISEISAWILKGVEWKQQKSITKTINYKM